MARREAWSSPNNGKGRRKRQSMDTGWNSRVQKNSEIPQYNSLADRYNPFTHTKKFAKRFANQKRLEEKERRERVQKKRKLLVSSDMEAASTSSPSVFKEVAREGVSYVADGISSIPQRLKHIQNSPSTGSPFLHNGRGGITTPHGGLSFQRTKSSDPSSELEVLKCILLREGYLERLHHLARRRGEETALRGDVIDVLDLIRISTVETVEAISKWKRTLVKPYPFVWNGVNYLLKIPSDLNFLCRFPEIETWLGFTLVRNPFIINICLDKRPSTPQVVNTLNSHMSSSWNEKNIGRSVKFHQIGSVDPSVYLRAQNFASKQQQQVKASKQQGNIGGALGGISGVAYETPVINDTNLVPASKKSSEIAERSMEKAKQEARIAAERPFPTHVGDIDMIRIRAAEKIILEEETIQGRMMRDEYGRLVPEALRAAMDAANDAANDVHPKIRRTKTDKVKEVNEVQQGSNDKVNNKSYAISDKMMSGVAKGKTRARKSGGHLHALSRKGISGRVRQPRRGRARAARLDAEIKKKQADNSSLAMELERAKQELQETRTEVARLESAEKGDSAATTIQSAARARKARIELERRKLAVIQQQEQIAQREAELVEKQEELKRKEAARDEYRRKRLADQQSKRGELLEKKFVERKDRTEEFLIGDQVEPESIEDISATKIQRLVRGKLARGGVRRRRKRYNHAATCIQAGFRGRVSRLDVKRRVRERDSATHMQRIIRGHLGRERVQRIRLKIRKSVAATNVQRIFRAFKGRRRMQAKKDLKRFATESKIAIERLFASDIAELCSLDKPAPIVVALCTCVRILWPAGQGPPSPIGSKCYSWERLRRRMRRPHFLPRLRALSASAVEEILQIPERRANSVKVYYNDPDFHTDTFRRIGNGAKAATALYIWLRAIVEANDRIKIFLPANQNKATAWCEAEMDRIDSESSDDEVLEKELVKRYVSHAVLRCPIIRPRPLLIAVARDIPSWPRKNIVKNLMQMLPGAFARVDMDFMDAQVLQSALDTGQSLIVDVDIGIGAATRRAFVSAFDTVKKTLQPTPLCLCVRGDLRNRHGGGINAKLGVREGLLRMADRELKIQLESAAEALVPLNTHYGRDALKSLGDMEKPDYPTCLILEAVLILINPQKTFKGPAETVGYVSWEASRTLLKEPMRLLKMIQRVDVEQIPFENLRALFEYVDHGAWPNLGKLPRNGLKQKRSPEVVVRGDEDSSRQIPDLFNTGESKLDVHITSKDELLEPPAVSAIIKLCEWVNAVVKYSRMLAENGGVAPSLNRKTSPFESVTIVRDNAPDAYGGVLQGWREALANLYAPVLRDMKVYGEARKINGGKGSNMVVSVYRDRQRIYFGAYDPKESVQRWAVTEDAAVNRLLAPNSIEQQGTPKPKPETPLEMYRRLVALLHLERPRGSIHERVDAPPTDLVIRRDLLPLFKESRKIDGVFAIINAAEEAPGEVRIHAYVPKQSFTYSLLVDEETIAKLASVSTGVEKYDLQSGDGRRLVGPIVDRLQFKTKRAGTLAEKMHLVLRMKGIGGRKILSTGLLIGKKHHILSLFERAGELRVEVYRPAMSKRHLLVFDPRERVELLGGTNWGEKPKWVNNIFNRLSLKGSIRETKKQDLVFDRSVHSQGARISTTYLTVTFSLPQPWDPALGGIIISAYDPIESAKYIMQLNDDDVRTLLELQSLRDAGVVKDGKRLGVEGVDHKPASVKERIVCMNWPDRIKSNRTAVFAVLSNLLHWQSEPQSSGVPCLGIGDKLSPLMTVFRSGIKRQGRIVTSAHNNRASIETPFEECGERIFDGDHTVGLRNFKLQIREEVNESGRRVAFRVLGRENRGESTHAGSFSENELQSKLGYFTTEGEIQVEAKQLIPKFLQRLRCKAGAFILENRPSSSRGSSRSESRPTPKHTNHANHANHASLEKETRQYPCADKISDLSESGQRYGVTEIIDFDGTEGHNTIDAAAIGDRIYCKGVKIAPVEQREGSGPPDRIYYVVTAYLEDPDKLVDRKNRPITSTTKNGGGRFSSYGLENGLDRRKWRVSLYDPNTSKHVGVTIGAKELKEVCGKRTDLCQRGREVEMTEYIIRNRLELRPVMRGPPGADTIDGKGELVHERLTLPLSVKNGVQPPPYRLELIRARVFTRDKVTPLNKSGLKDVIINNEPAVLIETDKSKSSAPYVARGLKILNMAYRVPIPATIDQPNGSMEFLMLSFFDMTNKIGSDAQVSSDPQEVVLPRLRLIAYNPKHSYKLKCIIAGPDLVKIISSRGVVDTELLLPNRRVELVKIVAKCVRLQRRRNALPNILTVPLEQALEEEQSRKAAAEEDEKRKQADRDARLREEEFRFKKAELVQKRKDDARRAATGKTMGQKTKKYNLNGNEQNGNDFNINDNSQAVERWAVAAKIINATWREAMLIEDHQFVISATALYIDKATRAREGSVFLYSSESDIDIGQISDEEELAARSQLRLMLTAYSPLLAEAATVTVPNLTIVNILGGALETLSDQHLANGLVKLTRYLEFDIKKINESNVTGAIIEPRLSILIDPGRKMRPEPGSACKHFQISRKENEMKEKQIPERGVVSSKDPGEEIFHRGMRINDTGGKSNYVLVKVYITSGTRGKGYRFEAYSPKLSHTAALTISEARLSRILGGRADLLLPSDNRSEYIAIVCSNLLVKNAEIEAHMRMVFSNDIYENVENDIRAKEVEINHLRAMSGWMGGICASGKHYLMKAVMENDKVCLKLRLVKDFSTHHVVVGGAFISSKCKLRSPGALIRSMQDGDALVLKAVCQKVEDVLSKGLS